MYKVRVLGASKSSSSRRRSTGFKRCKSSNKENETRTAAIACAAACVLLCTVNLLWGRAGAEDQCGCPVRARSYVWGSAKVADSPRCIGFGCV